MEQFKTPKFIKFRELIDSKRVKMWVIDGLDGAGKGTIADALAQKQASLGRRILKVELPHYTTNIGSKIRKVLKSDLNLTLEQRMSLFAINRLEIIDKLVSEVISLSENSNQDIIILFDRFSSSNLLTYAFYLRSTLFANKTLDELRATLQEGTIPGVDLDMVVGLMKTLDEAFHRLLGIDIEDTKIFIPGINPETAYKRITSDGTREGSDRYEELEIQTIAQWLYTQASYGKMVVKYQQEDTSPAVITDMANEEFDQTAAIQNGSEGSVSTLHVLSNETDYSPEVEFAINSLKERYFGEEAAQKLLQEA